MTRVSTRFFFFFFLKIIRSQNPSLILEIRRSTLRMRIRCDHARNPARVIFGKGKTLNSSLIMAVSVIIYFLKLFISTAIGFILNFLKIIKCRIF